MDRNNDDPATLGLRPQLSGDLIHSAPPSGGRIGIASGPWTHGKYVHVIEGLASSSGITVSAPRTTFAHVCPSPSLLIQCCMRPQVMGRPITVLHYLFCHKKRASTFMITVQICKPSVRL